jgi:rare lipoprotein A
VSRSAFAGALLCVMLLSGCGMLPKRTAPDRTNTDAGAPAPGSSSAPSSRAPSGETPKKSGGYYQDDGPGEHPPANLDAVPDAVPKVEPLRAAANQPYSVLGKDYVPFTSLKTYKRRGVASWYGRKFHGAKTSSGEIYDMYAMTAAHPTLPIPSYARVTNLANKRSVIVRVNDRGPFLSDRIMDLSYTAAYRLGYVNEGSATVEVESIDPEKYHPSKSTARLVPETAPVVAAPALPPPAPAPVLAATAPPPAESETETLPRQTAIPVADAPAPPVTMEASGIYVQLGAFSVRDNAEAFRARATRQLGWLNETIQMNNSGGLYRLQLGPYRDRAEAESVAARIRESMELKPTMVVK